MDEQVLEAELVKVLPVDKPNSTNSLNAAIGSTIAVVLVFLMLSRTIGAPLEEQAGAVCGQKNPTRRRRPMPPAVEGAVAGPQIFVC